MYVYNADRKGVKNKNFAFKHLGVSPIAAAERVEGMFAHQERCSISEDLIVSTHDVYNRIIKQQTLDQHLIEFCNYSKTFSISEYVIHANRPLRLIDLWEDDPIGSAGPKVVSHNQLTEQELKEVQSIFYPFTDVIYPRDIFSVMSLNDIKGIKRQHMENAFFANELKKRKYRSKAIGEDFNQAQYQEIVWLDLTFKLKNWALGKGFDSFVYSNKKEGNGEDTFVTLLPNQLEATGRTMEFIEDKYLLEMPKIISELVNSGCYKFFEEVNHLLWGCQNPMPYWK
ncbi:hypothetical protein ACXJY6_19685 [Vibrio sp. RC27]